MGEKILCLVQRDQSCPPRTVKSGQASGAPIQVRTRPNRRTIVLFASNLSELSGGFAERFCS
jgi:hypothetical protein